MNELNLIAVGDMMLGRGLGEMISLNGADFPFAGIKQVLAEGDILFGVLDAPVSLKGAPNPDKPKDYPKISCAPSAITALKNAGFDVIHAGTNHILDFGEEGLNTTIDLLDKNGINHIGAGLNVQESRSPAIAESNGIRMGFLGYCLSYPADNKRAGCAPLRLELIMEDVKNLRRNVNHVIVSLHHGIEYSLYPYPEYMDVVHSIVDAGARVVLGHHPHSIQGTERYKDALIIYSLGNFIFDKDENSAGSDNISRFRVKLEKDGIIAKPDTEKFYEGLIASIIFTDNDIRKVEYKPIVINNEFQPTPASGKRKEEIFGYFDAISSNLSKRELPFFRDLSRLYAEEDVGSFFKKDISAIIAKFHKIRPRHVKQLFKYLEARNVR